MVAVSLGQSESFANKTLLLYEETGQRPLFKSYNAFKPVDDINFNPSLYRSINREAPR